MQIGVVRYGRTFIRGGGEEERIELEAVTDPGESPIVVHFKLKAQVAQLGGDVRGAVEAERAADERQRQLMPQ